MSLNVLDVRAFAFPDQLRALPALSIRPALRFDGPPALGPLGRIFRELIIPIRSIHLALPLASNTESDMPRITARRQPRLKRLKRHDAGSKREQREGNFDHGPRRHHFRWSANSPS